MLEHERLREFAETCDIGSGTRITLAADLMNLGPKRGIKIGENCEIRADLRNYCVDSSIQIGNTCFIGEGSHLWCGREIVIGDHTLISHGVNIHDFDSHPQDPITRREEYARIFHDRKFPKNPHSKGERIQIGNDVWIGFNATILKGVTLGDGCIIGANSVITHDVPAGALVVGNPQRILSRLPDPSANSR